MKKYKIIVLTIVAFLIFTLVGCNTISSNKLDAPTIFISEGYVRWSKIDQADSYIININDEETTIQQIKYDLSTLSQGTYSIKVKAISNDIYEDSDYSNILTYTVSTSYEGVLSSPVLTIENNIVSWESVPNANKYKVYVNEYVYAETSNLNYTLTMTKEGTYRIYVIACDESGKYKESNPSNAVEYNRVEVIQTIEEVKNSIDISGTQEAKVHFVGQVIGFDSFGYAHVADNTGSIYVRAKNPLLYLGNIVKITGYGFVYTGNGNYPEYTRQIKESNLVVEQYDGTIEELKETINLTKDDINKYNSASNNYVNAPFMGNVVTITGVVEVGSTRYSFYLNDENGNHLVSIHHYSSNFQNNITDSSVNVFLNLDGSEVTLTGIMYRYYLAENIWTIQCIGLPNEVKLNEQKLTSPNIELIGDRIYWEQIPYATLYNVYVDGNFYEYTSECYYDLSYITTGRHEITVQAVDESNHYSSSNQSNKVVYLKDVQNENVNIFMINDTHGSFVDGDTPGVERVSTLIKELEQTNGDYIKIANGDFFQGSYAVSILYGLPMIDALNAMSFDAFIIGNHEFDWGLEQIHQYKDGDYSNGEADFPFVCANIYDKSTNQRVDWLEPYTIVENNGQRVGIIGIIGYSLESSILTANVKDYDFVYPLDIIKDYASELRNDKNCDSVIVSIHDYDSSLNRDIAALSGDSKIDAILCAHTHQNVYETITRSDYVSIPVVQNQDKNKTATSLVLQINDSSLTSWTFERYYPQNYAKDDEMSRVINKYQSTISEGNRVLGSTSSYLSRDTLGGHAVQAMKEEYQTDFAIMNTGGVRATISSGEITVAEVFEVFPFNNRVYITELSGKAIKSLYENNASYLYISNNYNASSIIDSKMYTLAVIDYVYTGEYYTEFKGTTYTDSGCTLRDIVIDYIDTLF